MTSRVSILVVLFFATAAGAKGPAPAAPPADEQAAASPAAPPAPSNAPGEDFELQLVRLVHADAAEAADIIRQTLRCHAAIDRRTNSLVVTGPAQFVRAAVEFLRELDQPQEDQDAVRSAIVRTGAGSQAALLDMIRTRVGSRTRFALDPDTRLLSLHGPEDDIRDIEKLVEEVERQAAHDDASGLRLTFYFIQGVLDDLLDAAPPASAMPAAGPPKDQTLADKLAQSIPLDVQDKALEELIDELAAEQGVNIIVNWSDLEGAGIDRDQPVTLRTHAPVSLRTTLDLVLEQIGGSEHLVDYAVIDGVIKVATPEFLDVLRRKSAGTPSPARHAPIPPQLEPAVQSLVAYGLKSPSLLAPLTVAVNRDNRFAISGSAAELDHVIGVRVEGTARSTAPDVVELEISASVYRERGVRAPFEGQPRVRRESLFELTSEISTRLGDFVVLATSPASAESGQALAVIVHATRIE